jgi:hypothetical protein
MAYKDNLLKKIKIDRLVRSIASEIGPVDSGKRIDKSSLQQLMHYFPWPHREEREMELYIEDASAGKTRILVLDNDLTLYRTTVDDVVLRKNPTVKEMVSIRNAIKILNDKDVVVSRKEASLKTVQQICIGELDLKYSDEDINAMAEEGKSSLESGYAPGVQESLALFAELLGFVSAPKAFSVKHFDIYGKIDKTPGGEAIFGPLVMFSLVDNTLTCLDTPLRSRDKGRFDLLKAAAAGKEEAVASGNQVFDLMAAKVPAADTNA